MSDDIILAKLQLSEHCEPGVANRQQLVTFMVLSLKGLSRVNHQRSAIDYQHSGIIHDSQT